MSSHCEMTSRTPCLKVPVYPISLFSGSKTVTFVTSVSPALSDLAARFLTVAELDESVGMNGGDTMTR